MFHDKSKHIEIKYHFIQDMVQKGAVKLKYVPTEEQVVDVLTKPLSWCNPKGTPSKDVVGFLL